MGQKNKGRKRESWSESFFRRIKDNQNRIDRGTVSPRILENPFISRAYDKIMRNYSFRVLGMCLSGIAGSVLLSLIWDALCQSVFGMSSRDWLGRHIDNMISLLFFGLAFWGYAYGEKAFFHSMDKVLLKYWTCPFCHEELPYKMEPHANFGNARFHLLPGAKEDCCPYCGKRLRILSEEEGGGKS